MGFEKNRPQENGASRTESSGGDSDAPAAYPRKSPTPPPDLDCDGYERLIRELDNRVPESADFDRLSAHEAACPTGKHSEAGVEDALGLPRGALRNGAPELGLPPPRQLIGWLIDKHIEAGSRSTGRCPVCDPRLGRSTEEESHVTDRSAEALYGSSGRPIKIDEARKESDDERR